MGALFAPLFLGGNDVLNKIRPTKAEQRRFLAMHDRGCVPCYVESQLRGRKHAIEPGEIHHVEQANSCGHHRATYCACPWHHRGVRKTTANGATLTGHEMTELFGPSMARNPMLYLTRYGDADQLLALQEAMLLESPERLTGDQ